VAMADFRNLRLSIVAPFHLRMRNNRCKTTIVGVD
jgi:hypothetical protein